MKAILKISLVRAIASASIVTVLLSQAPQLIAQQSVRVRVHRWLELQQLSGQVTYRNRGSSRRAQLGDRLQSVGDSISTGNNSTARLAVDTAVGYITLHSNTVVQIHSLDVAPDNGRVTRLQVSGGQVRLQVRPFTHQGSSLEVVTPSGVSGVRGTVFGVTVQPNGSTGLATLQGLVASSAQGESQAVPAGFQNLTIPGEPPSPPVPLKNDTSLTYDWQIILEGNLRRLQFNGQVDPVNLVYIEGELQLVDRSGRFSHRFPLVSSPRHYITVVTPLGKTETHEVVF